MVLFQVIFVLYVILNLFPFERAMAPRENRPRMANIREETMRKVRSEFPFKCQK